MTQRLRVNIVSEVMLSCESRAFIPHRCRDGL